MRNLDIILRTCDITNVHNDWRKRYHGIGKNKLVIGCLQSLVNSIKNTSDIDISLTVLDDHSTHETVCEIEKILSSIKNTRFVQLTERGYNNSAYQQWLLCKNSTSDLVYSVEDDYLHCPSAIQEMVDSFYLFCERLERKEVVIYPFDEPTEYNPPKEKSFVVHGSHRHWRTGFYTTNVLMTRPSIFIEHWNLFETLALKYNGDYLNPRVEHFDESNTIEKIWRSGRAIRFSPIPSLALHMQFDPQKDPYINWENWWNEYTK
jgi:glycosyltransferase involved in cell wall biosynthesis